MNYTSEERAGWRILVGDDDPHVASTLAKALECAGYTVDCAHSVEHAIAELTRRHYHAAIVDVRLAGRCGHQVLAHAAGLDDPPAVLMMARMANAGDVISAMRGGAADFFQKPGAAGELAARVESALDAATLRRKLKIFEARERLSFALPVIESNGAMRDALLLADRVAATPGSSALLVGETGVGKEVIASRIHDTSTRRGGPFVHLNLAAISENMLEAELFGSVKGAFTDSKTNRAGHLASADGGTILLDEIGEFRIEYQAKLLRVLEERRFFPVGSDRERAVNVRVIAATNRDPQVMIEAGRLRQDLFYRLGTVIHIPPLRERAVEIRPLAERFLHTFCAEFGRSRCRFTPAALTMLQQYPWPGNIRQLRNVVERAVMVSEGDEILPSAFNLAALQPKPVTPSVAPPARTGNAPHQLREVRERASADLDRSHVVRAMASANGSPSRAAALLGLSRSTLYDKLKRYNLR